jgi:hypothetical protein
MKKVIDLSAARKASESKQADTRKGTYRYASLVLKAWDDMDHAEKRTQREQAAEVRRKARNTL